MTQRKGRIGSSFEDYLAEQGTLEETTTNAVKRVLAWQLEQAMERRQMSKSAMARAMRTSRSQLDRILDPDNDRPHRERAPASPGMAVEKARRPPSAGSSALDYHRSHGDRLKQMPNLGSGAP